MAEPVTRLAELQGPPGWWYLGRERWGSAVRKQTLKHTRRGGEGKVSAKLAASMVWAGNQSVGAVPKAPCASQQPWAPQSLCARCPGLGTALAQVIQHSLCVHRAAEALTLLLALPWGWGLAQGGWHRGG